MKNQLSELENERANHQKLIKEYGKLEQRFEKVRSELLKYSKSQAPSGSLASSSGSFSQHPSELESLIEELENDAKQANFLSASVLSQEVANFDSNKLLYMTANGSEMDLTLVSKLNRRIAALEAERKEFLKNKPNINESEHLTEVTHDSPLSSNNANSIEKLQQEKDYELIKSQELELENQKLREDLNRLRDLVADNQSGKVDSLINKEMMSQFDALNEEVQRRRDECIHLKSLLVTRHYMSHRRNSGQNDDGSLENPDPSLIMTDGNEFEVGYNTQKLLNRILENQMNELKRTNEAEINNLQKELKQLKEENERQQNILMQNLTPETLAEATYKNEIMKLADQNLVSIALNVFYLSKEIIS